MTSKFYNKYHAVNQRQMNCINNYIIINCQVCGSNKNKMATSICHTLDIIVCFLFIFFSPNALVTHTATC